MYTFIKILAISTALSLCGFPQVVLAGSVIIIPIPVRVSPDVQPVEVLQPDDSKVESDKVEASDDDYKWKTAEPPKPAGSVKIW